MTATKSEYKRGDVVSIPTSTLGKLYGNGEVVAAWADKIAVDFSGHLGQYTIGNHTVKLMETEFLGMKVVIDETIPVDEIHVKFVKD